VLNLIEDQLAESILYVDKGSVGALFRGRSVLSANDANEVLSEFTKRGNSVHERKSRQILGLSKLCLWSWYGIRAARFCGSGEEKDWRAVVCTKSSSFGLAVM
jgi:hypothetical protein